VLANLINGFETPYGMELLLATVHWVVRKIGKLERILKES
jgi:hypothetical protein